MFLSNTLSKGAAVLRNLRSKRQAKKLPVPGNELNELKLVNEQPDFFIYVEEEVFPVHRETLASASEYFRALFDSGMRESREEGMRIEDVSAEVIRCALRFLYGEIVSISTENICDYLDIVELWLLDGLKEAIEGHICENLMSVDSCLFWNSIALRYCMDRVLKETRSWIMSKFVEVTTSDAFKTLSIADLKELLTEELMIFVGTDELLKSCLIWLITDPERKGCFSELVQHLKLSDCKPEFLKIALERCVHSLSKVETRLAADYIENLESKIEKLRDLKATADAVFILAGRQTETVLNKTVVKVDFEQETVMEIGTLPKWCAKYHQLQISTLYGVFCCGGRSELRSGFFNNVCFLLDVPSMKRVNLPSFPFALDSGRAAAAGRNIFVLPGTSSRLWQFDLNSFHWSKTHATIPRGAQLPVLFSTDDKTINILATTTTKNKSGSDTNQTQHIVNLHRYDVQRQKSKISTSPVYLTQGGATDMIGTGASVAVTADGGDVYIVGGIQQLCVRYSPRMDQWTTLERPTTRHRYGAAAAVATDSGSKIVLCGGRGGEGRSNGNGVGTANGVPESTMIEVYDCAANKWEVKKLLLPTPVFGQLCIPA